MSKLPFKVMFDIGVWNKEGVYRKVAEADDLEKASVALLAAASTESGLDASSAEADGVRCDLVTDDRDYLIVQVKGRDIAVMEPRFVVTG